jgi:predicted transcriptional regulator of viral defense system
MLKTDIITTLYTRPESVFSIQEIGQIFPHISPDSLRDRLFYFTKVGKLQRLHHGLYAKQKYDVHELANKIYTPSYISLETVLAREGVIFQHYETLFLMSYLTRDVRVGEHAFSYRRLPDSILLHTEGIERDGHYAMATKERAFLDAVYKYKNYHFDNLGGLNWDTVFHIKDIYQSKILTKRVDMYYQLYKEDYVDTKTS